MFLKHELNEALQWYQNGYTITNVPESIKVEDGFTGVVATFGTMEEDGYKVTMYFYNDGSIDRFFFNDENGSIETRDQEVANNLLHVNGAFMDFIHDSMNQLEKMAEKMAEKEYRKQQEAKVSKNPLD